MFSKVDGIRCVVDVQVWIIQMYVRYRRMKIYSRYYFISGSRKSTVTMKASNLIAICNGMHWLFVIVRILPTYAVQVQ